MTRIIDGDLTVSLKRARGHKVLSCENLTISIQNMIEPVHFPILLSTELNLNYRRVSGRNIKYTIWTFSLLFGFIF